MEVRSGEQVSPSSDRKGSGGPASSPEKIFIFLHHEMVYFGAF